MTSLPPRKIISGGGVGGWRHALNLRDLGSGTKMCYPTRTGEADDCVLALEKFLGSNAKPNRFYSDKEGGLVAASKRLPSSIVFLNLASR